MKIVCLLGSPRENGNSSTIARHFSAAAEKLGAEVKSFSLNKLNFRGCQGCMARKTNIERCALEDDLTGVPEAVRKTDVLVLASPVYFWDVSSQVNPFRTISG